MKSEKHALSPRVPRDNRTESVSPEAMVTGLKEKSKKIILAIETSCDETAMSVVNARKTKNDYKIEILSNVVASQIDLHKKWGGVYPELASRAHLEVMIPVLESAILPLAKNSKPQTLNSNEIRNSKIKNSELIQNSKFQILNSIDAIAVTVGPGLIGSLLMGVETAQSLGAYFNKPVIPVNHLEGHVYSAFCAASKKFKVKSEKFNTGFENCKIRNSLEIRNSKLEIAKTGIFPILALVVSGGHTSLILMKDHLNYKTVGQTIDDAAGEAFDKVARILGLGYPGGPAIEGFAVGGNENAYDLPLSMINSGNFDFSFSGLKTAVLYLTKDPRTQKPRKYNKKDLAASFQKTVSEILTKKTIQAIEKYSPKTVILSGGVSANEYLRNHFVSKITAIRNTKYAIREILIPPKNLSTDNALGIAIAGAIKFLNNCQTTWDKISARANSPIDRI